MVTDHARLVTKSSGSGDPDLPGSDGVPVMPDPDPESHRTFREGVSFPADKGILNRVQDDIGVAACAASLRSERFGSDATNDKQLSLALRVSHSGPRSGIPLIVPLCMAPA